MDRDERTRCLELALETHKHARRITSMGAQGVSGPARVDSVFTHKDIVKTAKRYARFLESGK